VKRGNVHSENSGPIKFRHRSSSALHCVEIGTAQTRRRHWDRITPFFAYPVEIRKVIYTTNAVESLNMSLRKIIKMWGSFPNAAADLLTELQGSTQQKLKPFTQKS
jgi:transposase-like protein